MERQLFLINKFRQLLIPMFECYFISIKIKVLDVIVAGICDLLEKSSALEWHFFLILIKRCDTGRPYIWIHEGISHEFLLVLAILAHLETICLITHDLSKKMVQLYKLSSEQLSQQDHYDFGMRAVKSVLVMAGSLKRADKNANEDEVLIRAMRNSNIPKFLKEDLPLF